MRVITGTARGKRLETLEGDLVRPTTARVKESVFNIIQFDIQGKRFLDLFSGSGQMGIEALSRGVSEAVFVDKNRESIDVIKRNLRSTGLSNKAIVVQADFKTFLSKKQSLFDIVYLDPPFAIDNINQIIEVVASITKRDGHIICETPRDRELHNTAGDFLLSGQYFYGKIMVSIFRFSEQLSSGKEV